MDQSSDKDQTNASPTVRFRTLKRIVGAMICSDAFGWLVGKLYGDVIPFSGTKINVNGIKIPSRNKALLYWGLYESAELRFVKAFLDTKLPTIELGASIGGISSQLASRLDQGASLVCIEANRELIAAVERNVKANAKHTTPSVKWGAVAYGSEYVEFQIGEDHLVSSLTGNSSHAVQRVPAIMLRDVAPQETYQLVSDIEGGEYDMLMHDKECLQRCSKAIIELHPVTRDGSVISIDQLKEMFCDCGFSVVASYGPVFVFER
jgi:FkbM family methyltransferase